MSGRMLILLLTVALGATTASFGHGGHSPDPSASLPPSPGPWPEASASPDAAPPVDAPFFTQIGDENGENHLVVGRLSSRAFDIVTDDPYGSGPVDGKVLAWWRDEDGTGRLALVDADTGASTPLYERRSRSLHGALSPDGRTAWWVERTRGRARGVFRLALDGAAEPERVAAGWDGTVIDTDWGTDGTTLVITTNTRTEPGAMEAIYDYRLLDTADGTLTGPIDFRGQTVVGLHDGRLIVFATDRNDAPYLASVDVATGEVTQLLDPHETSSARIADDAGTPVLVVSADHGGRYGLDRMALDGSDRRPLWTSDEPWDSPYTTLIRSTEWSDVESPGWVAVGPSTAVYPDADDRPGERLLVSVADGTVVELPSPPALEPGGSSRRGTVSGASPTSVAPVDAPWFASMNDGEGHFSFLVGRLSSSAFDVADSPKAYGSGPVDGKVLAWWREEDGTGRLALVDTATGASTPLYERRSRSLHGALSPDGRTAWWVEQTRHRVRGVFRLDLSGGGGPKRVADGWVGLVLAMDWSTDGRRMVITTLLSTEPGSMEALYEYRLLDTATGAVSDPIDATLPGPVVGLDGDDLVYYQIEPSDYQEAPLPLVSLDVTSGEFTELVSTRENRSAQLVDDGGTPVLVVDVPRDGHYALDRMAIDGSDRRPLWTSGEPWDEPWSVQVRQTDGWGAEVPGWVLVSGRGVPYPEPGRAPGERLLVSVADGTVVELLPPPPVSQPGEPPATSPIP